MFQLLNRTDVPFDTMYHVFSNMVINVDVSYVTYPSNFRPTSMLQLKFCCVVQSILGVKPAIRQGNRKPFAEDADIQLAYTQKSGLSSSTSTRTLKTPVGYPSRGWV